MENNKVITWWGFLLKGLIGYLKIATMLSFLPLTIIYLIIKKYKKA